VQWRPGDDARRRRQASATPRRRSRGPEPAFGLARASQLPWRETCNARKPGRSHSWITRGEPHDRNGERLSENGEPMGPHPRYRTNSAHIAAFIPQKTPLIEASLPPFRFASDFPTTSRQSNRALRGDSRRKAIARGCWVSALWRGSPSSWRGLRYRQTRTAGCRYRLCDPAKFWRGWMTERHCQSGR
jgi:hypothetical protein